MLHRIRFQMWLVSALLLTMGIVMTSAAKAQLQYRIQEAKVYVKMDFWKAPSSQSAEAWHFDPNNNGVWTQLPDDPTMPTAPPRAQFKVKDLFRHDLMPDPYIWFVAVDEIRVVAGSPGNFADVSGNAAYSEMIDRMIFAADPVSTGVQLHDPCGDRSWPIATGSELTRYQLHDHPSGWEGSYGMMMNKEGLLESTGWLWKNPAGVDESEVYIEFTLLFDMDQVPEFPLRSHRNVAGSWISAGGGCGYNFWLAEGQETAVKIGTPFRVPDEMWSELVVAVPQVLDHTATLQLYWRRNSQNTLLIDTPTPPLLPGTSLFQSDRQENNMDIYAASGSALEPLRLTFGPGADIQPAWSPDGSRIAFTSNRDGNNEIYIMNADGTDAYNLTQSAADERFPAWSPDGQWIAFTSDRDGNQEIYLQRVDGSELRNLTQNPANDSQPAWLGDWMVFVSDRDGNQEIYRMRLDGSEFANLTQNPAQDAQPYIAPDGSQIAFVSNRDGNLEVYLMGFGGENPLNFTQNPSDDQFPYWGPGMEWIAFTSSRDGNLEIYIARLDGSWLINFTNHPAQDAYSSWR